MSIARRTSAVFSVVVVLLAATSAQALKPKERYKKVVLRHVAPQRGTPPRIIEGLDAEIVHEYPDATMVYVAQDDLPEVARRAGLGKLEITVRDDFDILQLPGGYIDARRGTAASLPGMPLGPAGQAGRRGVYLLQFAGPITQAWREAVAAEEITFIQYIPYNAYIVAGRPEDLNRVARFPFIQFIDVFHAVLKTQAVARDAVVDILIGAANVPGTDDLLRALSRLSLGELSTETIGETEEELRIRGTFDGRDIDTILNERLVFAVSPVPLGAVADERAAQSLGPSVTSAGDLLPPGGRYKAWLESVCAGCATLYDDDFLVGLADLGFWAGPQNAAGATDPGPADLPTSRIVFGTDYTTTPPNPDPTPTTFDDLSGHGTFVASILAGNPATGTDPEGFLYGMGVAPSAGLVVTKIVVSRTAGITPVTLSAHDARTSGAFIQNHSYNESIGSQSSPNHETPCNPPAPDGKYSVLSQDFDRAVRDSNGNATDGLTPITLVVSAGNQADTFAHAHCTDKTLVNPPATAKNVIAVGGTETPRTESWACRAAGTASLNNVERDSKRGTADAGWYKPDLMAPAANITSLLDDSKDQTIFSCPAPPDTRYALGTGTSFAAPVGSSAALLASRAYSATPGQASPALLKAMLIMGARSMKDGSDYGDRTNPGAPIDAIPSKRQGFGRISMEDVLARYPARSFINENHTLIVNHTNNSTWDHAYTVHDGNRPVTVVLTWTDAPGQVSVGSFITNPLVNDLDLAVYQGATCTERYLGNHVSETNERSTPVGCADATHFDRKNNAEIARFTAATGTTFHVTVKFESGTGGPQPFALAVHNAYDASLAPPPVAPTGVTAQGTASTSATVSWNATPGATAYDVRRWDGGPFWQTIASGHTTTSVTTGNLQPMTTYLFDVTARNNTGASPPSTPDAATTFAEGTTALFTDDPLIPGVTILKAAHLNELRSAITAVHTAAGLGAPTYTDPTLTPATTPVRAVHIEELRMDLDAARQALNLPALPYTDPTLANGAIKAVHLQELRNAVK